MKYRVLKDFLDDHIVLHLKDNECEFPDTYFTKRLISTGFIEEVKDEPWKPKDGQTYYIVNDIGHPDEMLYDSEGFTDGRIAVGNCFETKEQAEKAVEWIKAFKVLREDTKGFKPESLGDGYTVWYDTADKELRCGWNAMGVNTIIYFATEVDAEKSIEQHPNEWRTFLGIEEDE